MTRFGSRLALALFLSIGAVLLQTCNGHFFWAETNEAADRVTVTFSENAGVPDKVIAMMESRVTKIAYTQSAAAVADAKVDVALHLNGEKTALEGDLPHSGSDTIETNGPSLVSGYLDFGPFEKFQDLEYSFGAQVYSSEEDYDGFFRPQLKGADKPSIVMRNCGGSKNKGSTSETTRTTTTSYQFDVGGFPSEGPLGVCIYRKGGLQMGCGEFSLGSLEEPQRDGVSGETSLGRTLFRGGNPTPNNNLSIELVVSSEAEQVQQQVEVQEAPYILYAIANKTITDKASGENGIAFASTSVYFEGPCQQWP